MDKQSKIKVVDRIKALELLECKSTVFYNSYYPRLKDSSVFGNDGRKRLFLLEDVMAIKKEIDNNFEIVK